MVRKVGDKKLDKVKESSSVKETKDVQDVSSVAGTAKVGRVGATGSASTRRPTRSMTPEERKILFELINQEAQKMFPDSAGKGDRREVVAEAVKMAIDSAILDEDAEPEKPEKPKK